MMDFFEEGLKVYRDAILFANSSFLAFDKAVQDAKKRGQKVCLYGVGAVGIMGHHFSSLDTDIVRCFCDDNASFWGNKIEGSKVLSLAEAVKNQNDNFVLSVNPCYSELLVKKLKTIGVDPKRIFLPEISDE